MDDEADIRADVERAMREPMAKPTAAPTGETDHAREARDAFLGDASKAAAELLTTGKVKSTGDFSTDFDRAFLRALEGK